MIGQKDDFGNFVPIAGVPDIKEAIIKAIMEDIDNLGHHFIHFTNSKLSKCMKSWVKKNREFKVIPITLVAGSLVFKFGKVATPHRQTIVQNTSILYNDN